MRTGETTIEGFTAQVAKEAAAIGYTDLPPHALTSANHVLLDWGGAVIAGSVESDGRIAQAIASETESHPVASIIGTVLRSSPREAAMANAIVPCARL